MVNERNQNYGLSMLKHTENLQLLIRGDRASVNIDYLSTEKTKTELNCVANPVFIGSCYPRPQIHL